MRRLVSLFNGISTFVGYLMPKLFSLKICSHCILQSQPTWQTNSKVSQNFCNILVTWGLVFLFNGISTSVGCLMPKLFSLKNSSGTTIVVHTFPKGIFLKVNVIAQLEYELTYYDSTVHRFNYYTTRSPPTFRGLFSVKRNVTEGQ